MTKHEKQLLTTAMTIQSDLDATLLRLEEETDRREMFELRRLAASLIRQKASARRNLQIAGVMA